MRSAVIVAALCVTLLTLASAAAAAADSTGDRSRDSATRDGQLRSSAKSARDRGLITLAPRASSIYKEHKSVYLKGEPEFEGTVLAYVTPWNAEGYTLSRLVAHKVTYFVPCLYHVDNRFAIKGRSNLNRGWMTDVRAKGAQVLPRFSLDQLDDAAYVHLLQDSATSSALVAAIAAEVHSLGFDGCTLDLGGRSFREFTTEVHSFIKALSLAVGRRLIVAVPPVREPKNPGFAETDLAVIEPIVLAVSVMTYDFAGPKAAGPVSPLAWLRAVLAAVMGPNPSAARKSKVLLGINLYGMRYELSAVPPGEKPGDPPPARGSALTGSQYLALLAEAKPTLTWDTRYGEHSIALRGGGDAAAGEMVWFPTLASLDARLQLAREFGVGVALWEMGQALAYWTDLL